MQFCGPPFVPVGWPGPNAKYDIFEKLPFFTHLQSPPWISRLILRPPIQ